MSDAVKKRQESRNSFIGSKVRSEVRPTSPKSRKLFDVGKCIAKSVNHHHINTVDWDLRKAERAQILQTNKKDCLTPTTVPIVCSGQ